MEIVKNGMRDHVYIKFAFRIIKNLDELNNVLKDVVDYNTQIRYVTFTVDPDTLTETIYFYLDEKQSFSRNLKFGCNLQLASFVPEFRSWCDDRINERVFPA